MEGGGTAETVAEGNYWSSCGSAGDDTDEDFRLCHSFSLQDYVVIHNCEPACTVCQFVQISDKQALQIKLCEERARNETYREKLTEILERYGMCLRQLEYQSSLIDRLTAQLQVERRNFRNARVSSEYAIIESSLIEDWQSLENGGPQPSWTESF